MKKLLAALVIIGGIVCTVSGIGLLYLEYDYMQGNSFYSDFDMSASVFICVLLICSLVFAILLVKKRLEGGILLLLSSAIVLCFGLSMQASDIIFNPEIVAAARIVPGYMILVTAVYIFLYRQAKPLAEPADPAK